MEERIDSLGAEGQRAFQSAASTAELEAARVRFLGRKSELTQLLRGLRDLTPDIRGQVGARANDARERLEAAHAEALARLSGLVAATTRDVTLPGRRPPVGHRHLLTSVFREIETIFRGLGFSLAAGPDVEDEAHNFTALNIPEGHPAREESDTFYLQGGAVLRTHTSPVQVRTMEWNPPPIRIICPGRCYRNEAIDATHHVEFHQVEGLYVDRGVSLADLKGTLDHFLKAFFGRKTEIRFCPSYYPFVEPGASVDIRCFFCGGKGCRVCKQSGWVEQLGCGLVHPNVLRMSKIDPEQWNGFAFGLGLTRLVMMRYAIDDIRQLQGGDLRFLRQF